MVIELLVLPQDIYKDTWQAAEPIFYVNLLNGQGRIFNSSIHSKFRREFTDFQSSSLILPWPVFHLAWYLSAGRFTQCVYYWISQRGTVCIQDYAFAPMRNTLGTGMNCGTVLQVCLLPLNPFAVPFNNVQETPSYFPLGPVGHILAPAAIELPPGLGGCDGDPTMIFIYRSLDWTS